MAQIAILGGGAAGLPVAYEMAELARPGDRVTLISGRSGFCAAAAAPWGATPAVEPHEVEYPIAPALERHGIELAAAEAKRVHPRRNQVELADGSLLAYDFLVIASGPKLAFDEIEGLGPEGYTHSLCHADHLPACGAAWSRLLANPGAVIVGIAQGATCFAPAYECALRIDADLRRRKLRERTPLTFVTAERFIGELGVDGAGDSRQTLETALRARDIGWIVDARVSRVERGRMRIAVREGGSARRKARVLPFRFAMMMPPFRGVDAIARIRGLVDRRGFVLVDEHQRNLAFPNIYAAGVTVASPRSPRTERSTAYMIESSASVVAQNIRDELDGRSPCQSADWRPVTLADLGAPGLAFIPDQETPAQAESRRASGAWIHMTRCSSCDAEV